MRAIASITLAATTCVLTALPHAAFAQPNNPPAPTVIEVAKTESAPLTWLTSTQGMALENSSLSVRRYLPSDFSVTGDAPDIETMGVQQASDSPQNVEPSQLRPSEAFQLHQSPTMETAVAVPDAALNNALRTTLQLSEDDELTTGKMATLTELDLFNLGVSDLTGLEHAVNLKALDLYGNKVVDLTPLTELVELEELYAWTNPLDSLQPIVGLPKLKYLFLNDTKMSDYSDIGQLETLEYLAVNNNNISDIDFVRHLPHLTRFYAGKNNITDATPLSEAIHLTHVSFGRTQISDLDWCKNLHDLLSLNLIYTHVDNLGALQHLPHLDYLGINDTQVRDLSALKFVPNLTGLQAPGIELRTVEPLAHLTHLRSLSISNNALTDISALSQLKQLEHIDLDNNSIDDLSPLKHLPLHREHSSAKEQALTSSISAVRSSAQIQALIFPVRDEDGERVPLIAPENGRIDSAQSTITWPRSAATRVSVSFKIAPSETSIEYSGIVSYPVAEKHTNTIEETAKAAVDGVVSPDGKKLVPGWSAAKLSSAQEAVNKLPYGATRDELQQRINEAKRLINFLNGHCNTTREKPIFKDVLRGEKFYREIDWLHCKGYTTGYDDGNYRPANHLTREAMAAFMYRLAAPANFTPPAKSPFVDVQTNHKFYTAIAWMKDSGLSTGYADGSFRPKDALSREAMAAFLYRFNHGDAQKPIIAPFTDVAPSQKFAREIAWMKQQKLSTGYTGGLYRPKGTVSREAMAAFIYRMNHPTKQHS